MNKKAKRRAQKSNPIIAAAKRGLKEGRLVTLGKWDEQRPEEQLDNVRGFFTDEAIYEVGSLILGALVAGDKQMDKTIRAAIKEADRIFGRNLEKNLLEKALRYTLRNWNSLLMKHHGWRQPAVDELKKGFERDSNNGKELEQYQWSRLRRALGLPKRSCAPGGGTPLDSRQRSVVVSKKIKAKWRQILLGMVKSGIPVCDPPLDDPVKYGEVKIIDYAPTPKLKSGKRRTSSTKRLKSVS